MRYQGKVTTWKDDQGFGFITPNGGGKEVFLHIKSFVGAQRRPVLNDVVSYELKLDPKGRAQADSPRFAGAKPVPAPVAGDSKLPMLFMIACMGFVGVSAVMGKLPFAVPIWYCAASVIAYVMYAWDKSSARMGAWRTEETTLHFVALIGGWPGAMLAQRWIRHKSRKLSFRQAYWLTVALNCAALGWLITQGHMQFLWALQA